LSYFSLAAEHDKNINKNTITGNMPIFDIYLFLDIFIVLYIL